MQRVTYEVSSIQINGTDCMHQWYLTVSTVTVGTSIVRFRGEQHSQWLASDCVGLAIYSWCKYVNTCLSICHADLGQSNVCRLLSIRL